MSVNRPPLATLTSPISSSVVARARPLLKKYSPHALRCLERSGTKDGLFLQYISDRRSPHTTCYLKITPPLLHRLKKRAML